MVWLVWIAMGGLVGCFSTLVVRSRQGLPTNMIVGVAGAFLGEILFNAIAASSWTALNVGSMSMAILCAVVLLGVGRLRVGRVRATF